MSKGKAAAQMVKHGNVLRKIDADGPTKWSDEQAAEAFGCSARTVFGIRQRLVGKGLEAALARKKRERPPIQPLLDGEKEARLVQIACSQPPAGQARWSLKLLAAELIAFGVVESISPQTVMRTRKQTH